MKWINSSIEEPKLEGKYFVIHNNEKMVLDFIIIIPNPKRWSIGSPEKEMLNKIKFWTKDVNTAEFIYSNENLLWVNEN